MSPANNKLIITFQVEKQVRFPENKFPQNMVHTTKSKIY